MQVSCSCGKVQCEATGDVPAYRAFPARFFAKLLFARIAMLFA
jgi:hypothetical protein